MFRESKLILVILIIFLVLAFASTAFSIEIGKPVAESADKRYAKFPNGTILDRKTNLIWMEKDYCQMEAKWVNWYTAREYAQKMNHKRFGGYQDWRIPTAKEAESLYDRRKRNRFFSKEVYLRIVFFIPTIFIFGFAICGRRANKNKQTNNE